MQTSHQQILFSGFWLHFPRNMQDLNGPYILTLYLNMYLNKLSSAALALIPTLLTKAILTQSNIQCGAMTVRCWKKHGFCELAFLIEQSKGRSYAHAFYWFFQCKDVSVARLFSPKTHHWSWRSTALTVRRGTSGCGEAPLAAFHHLQPLRGRITEWSPHVSMWSICRSASRGVSRQ